MSVCSDQCAVQTMQYVILSMQCAPCSVRYKVCSVHFAELCSVQCARLIVLCTLAMAGGIQVMVFCADSKPSPPLLILRTKLRLVSNSFGYNVILFINHCFLVTQLDCCGLIHDLNRGLFYISLLFWHAPRSALKHKYSLWPNLGNLII